MLLVLAPLLSLSLAGQEHGRTIPLPEDAAYPAVGFLDGTVGINHVVPKGSPMSLNE
jgi:hypothetical protein